MKLHARAEFVRAMETIARSINSEEVFSSWLLCGVADGDIDGTETDEDLSFYCEDETLSELMDLFLRLMSKAKKDGGLYIDKVTN